MTEFQKVLDRFPTKEDQDKLSKIVNKYGIESFDENNSLIDHPELSKNPKELMFLYYYLNAQQKSSSLERFIFTLLGGEKVKASEDRGDTKISGKFYEIKTSTTNQGNCLNIRQIRLYQDIDYYICSYIYEKDLQKSKTYLLSKKEMEQEVKIIGGYTHGTKAANILNKNPEYSITIDVFSKNNEHTRRWNSKYWYQELYDKLNQKSEVPVGRIETLPTDTKELNER